MRGDGRVRGVASKINYPPIRRPVVSACRRFGQNPAVQYLLFGCAFVVAAGAVACGDDAGAGEGGQPGTTDSSASGAGGQGGLGGQGGEGGCDQGPELHVLFIGNSHTYVNDVPALVRDLACSAGTNVVVQSVTGAGLSLVDHASDPAVLEAIASEAWDFAVLQDQQQRPAFRLPEVDAVSVPAAEALVEAIRANSADTVPLFYMVWARENGDAQNCDYYPLVCTYEGNTRAVSEGYGLYAERTATDVIPVAFAWAAVVADPSSPMPAGELWSEDGSHASVAGSYFAASMIAGRLLSLPAAPLGYEAGLAPPVAEYLRAKGDDVLAAHLANPRVDTVERVFIACEWATCSSRPDTSPAVFSLSSGSCAEIAAGSATIAARIRTTLDCFLGACVTVPLSGWHDVSGSAVVDGSYSVHAHVDLDDDGAIDAGELEACEDAAFVVGGGVDLTLTTFAPHEPQDPGP